MISYRQHPHSPSDKNSFSPDAHPARSVPPEIQLASPADSTIVPGRALAVASAAPAHAPKKSSSQAARATGDMHLLEKQSFSLVTLYFIGAFYIAMYIFVEHVVSHQVSLLRSEEHTSE